MKAGGWLCMECGTAAPQFGNFTGDSFPLEEILKPNFGKKEDFGGECSSSLCRLSRKPNTTHCRTALVPDSEKIGGIFVPKGDWYDKGNAVIVSTQFDADDYAEFLTGSWEEFPLSEMVQLTVKPE